MHEQQQGVFIGTQGQGPGEGIFALQLDETSGALTMLGLAAELARPTWLLRDPQRPVLYAVSELGNKGDADGEVCSFRIEDASLQLIDRQTSGGGGPTHLALSPDGTALFIANFGGGQAAALAVAADGSFPGLPGLRQQSGNGPHRRQQGPHPHGVTLDPSGRWLLCPDMGADRVFIHPWNAETSGFGDAPAAAFELPAGSGPRLIEFGPGGRHAYLLSELSAELFALSWDAAVGELALLASTPLDLPGESQAPSAAALAQSANGRFLYASNRQTHAIQVYAIDPECGLLSEVQRIASGGEKPWSAQFSPSGKWLLVTNQGSDTVCSFRVDGENGSLAPGATISVPMPTSVAFA